MDGWLTGRMQKGRGCLDPWEMPLVWSLALWKPGGPGETGFGEEEEEDRVQRAVR